MCFEEYAINQSYATLCIELTSSKVSCEKPPRYIYLSFNYFPDSEIDMLRYLDIRNGSAQDMSNIDLVVGTTLPETRWLLPLNLVQGVLYCKTSLKWDLRRS